MLMYISSRFGRNDIAVAPKRMDATLLQSEPRSIFRQEPSLRSRPRMAKNRRHATHSHITRESPSNWKRPTSQAVQIPESWGLGNETYFGRVNVFHQIHCLDALRREAYFEHYYGKHYPNGFNDKGEFHRLHLSHCVYLLLQNIKCSASMDVYTHIWTDTWSTLSRTSTSITSARILTRSWNGRGRILWMSRLLLVSRGLRVMIIIL